MKYNKLYLVILALLVLLMAGCAAREEAKENVVFETTPPAQTQPVETAEEAAEEDVMEGDAATYYINEVYAQQIGRYYTALTEQWDEGRYYEEGMSALAAYYYEGNPLDNVGFAFADLDNDGDWELIIGAIQNTDLDPAIFEIWTLAGEYPVMLVQSGYRNRFYVEYTQEDNLWVIANEASSSAANSANVYYTLDNSVMNVMQAVVFDAYADEANPWFLAYDNDWDTSNDTPIDEEQALAIMDSHSASYTVPEYFPYSLYRAE